MQNRKWLFHPILILVFSIIALATSLFLYIHSYIAASARLAAVARRFNLDPSQLTAHNTWVIITILSILVGVILLGIFFFFVYNLKTNQLYRMQHNFINNFTHELKTPVTSLRLYLETFLAHQIDPESQKKYLNYMLADVNRLSSNISRILDLARIESKTYGGDYPLMDVCQVVRHFVEENSRLFQGCEIQTQNICGPPLTSHINVALFEMLLMNIIVNAVKYNESEHPEIVISASCNKNKIILTFTDNGIGFAKKHRKKIFRQFFQAGRSEDMSAKGSGIGLYLVQNIARMHKGKIFAKSKGVGRGAAFTLVLPKAKETSS